MLSIETFLEKIVNSKFFVLFAFLIIMNYIFLLVIKIDFFPLNYFWFNHADTILIDQISIDFLSTYWFDDIRFTQAAYIFPDILFGIIVKILSQDFSAAKSFSLFAPIVSLTGWWIFLKYLNVNKVIIFTSLLLGLFLYGLSLIINPQKVEVLLYFTLIGHHSAIGIMFPFVLLSIFLIFDFFNNESKNVKNKNLLSLTVALLLLFLLAISDSLIVIGIFVPFVLYTFFSLIVKKNIEKQVYLIHTSLILIIITIASNFWLSNLNYPQKKEFSEWVLFRFLEGFPQITYDSIFYLHDFIFANWLLTGLFVVWGSVICLSLYKVINNKFLFSSVEDEKINILLFILFFGSIFTIFLQVLLGLFNGSPSSRQFAGLMLSSIILMPLVMDKIKNILLIIIMVLFLLSSFYVSKKFSIHGDEEVKILRNSEDIKCVKQALNNYDFVSDFWIKVPVQYYTQNNGVSLGTLNAVFTNGQNVNQIRKSFPKFVIVYKTSSEGLQSKDIFYNKFGAASNEVECGQYLLLDYSDNQHFQKHFSALAKSAY